MSAHDCSQECRCGHWNKPRRFAHPVKGRITLDVYDGLSDHDANAYKNYEPEDPAWEDE
jgi:hypothetical protein